MISQATVDKFTKGYSFRPMDAPGFIGVKRRRPDGVPQSLRVFAWENRAYAAEQNMPYAYFVLCPGFTSYEEQTRIACLRAVWPSTEQTRRPAAEVVAQLRKTFMPLFDLTHIERWPEALERRTYEVENASFRCLR